MTQQLSAQDLRVHRVAQDDPLAAPLLAELAVEYSSRYGRSPGEMHASLRDYPATEFAPPHGALLVVTRDSEPVAGGAFQRYDAETAELKRIWTAREHRRQGLGLFVLAQLEAEIERRGYRRIYLTTGPRQPEAVGLYLAAGYTALYDPAVPAEELGKHPFEKRLPAVTDALGASA
ncbi:MULTISPECIES: GNAT family N-acetyltransferase [Nocardia]|uniref:Putative acetyltransferase, GNAT n=1 Tax=Nocardia ninae NBRC 108245 TaxID=1210091 RepID=A0A511MGR4_9NOCA|nr:MULTISPECIES: GNAT family N-acetyltransferase [Nocardia]QBS44068.1 GNAT family N-acetyltransferase [Nocardia sp. CS682]GEM39883.1 putative acetyltransferase, GNAT [Nocardia ninae NBRC 108245]